MTNYKFKLKLLETGIKKHICENCFNTSWMNSPIPLEIHHIDGNSSNNDIVNIKLLCPNCHALTPNYRGKNKTKKVESFVSDEQMISAITNSYTVRHALLSVGLKASGGNYKRIRNLIQLNGLEFKKTPMSDLQKKRMETIERKYGSLSESIKTKIEWPKKEELELMIENQSISSISRKLGVSVSGVRKAAIRYGIDVRSLSKWSQKHGS